MWPYMSASLDGRCACVWACWRSVRSALLSCCRLICHTRLLIWPSCMRTYSHTHGTRRCSVNEVCLYQRMATGSFRFTLSHMHFLSRFTQPGQLPYIWRPVWDEVCESCSLTHCTFIFTLLYRQQNNCFQNYTQSGLVRFCKFHIYI